MILVFIKIQAALGKIGANLTIGLTKPLGLWLWIVVLAILPVVKAAPVAESPFPNITFKVFNEFVKQQFSSKIPLSTVLVILFSLTENTDLLNLHARQQYVQNPGEHRTLASGWIKSLARALKENIDVNQAKPLKLKHVDKNADEEKIINAFSLQLDSLSKLLGLHSYDSNGKFQGNLKAVSHKTIQPVHVICPITTECETEACNSRSLLQLTQTRDVPRVTLIKEFVMYKDVCVLTGKCSTCETKYFADHERAVENREQKKFSRVYLNSAKYLKVGWELWVDQLFANGVVNGMYSFHAPAAAYTDFWNDTFSNHQSQPFKSLTRRQIWQAFVQESLRSIATTSNYELVLQDALAIDEVTKEAFAVLGNNGRITAANNHSCSECTHEYKATADTLIGATQAVENASQEMNESDSDSGMNVDKAMVTMCVVDGIVMGPTVCQQYFYVGCCLQSF